MSRRLWLLVFGVTLAAAVLLAAAVRWYPLESGISVTRQGDGLWLGLAFWTGLALLTAALPVRMPGGDLLDLSFAPILAALYLGGPLAGGWVALVGTTQARELGGAVPWFGLVANHAAIVVPAILSALLLQYLPGRDNPAIDLLATVAAAASCFSLNVILTAAFTSLRTQESLRRIVRTDTGGFVSMLALTPIAWLMARMYLTSGWWAVLLFAFPLYTTRLAYQRFVEVREMFTQTVRSLAEAVDKRDNFTRDHSNRVQQIALDIGRVMKLGDEDLEALEWGGLLHDIGKIGVPDAVLLKQERLTREERAIMNAHPILGAEIIEPVARLAPELPIILHHHEWFNGSGYPGRLVADDIPKLARILHVADAFEAMTAQRPYRMTPLTHQQALGELHKFGGIQFDPDVVDAFEQTQWARVTDPARTPSREVPLLAEQVGLLTATVTTEGLFEASGAESAAITTTAPA